ncbi:hypothetical protein AMTR_s00011p00256600 [Amborella trichopoda]|uniref:Uncharacterized protein n=1 Tax=Amborella trichopoda TaxID=13333 RepID=W1NHV6_AMBTC|nr:hypothetical protein AMTR_s00011p00256600 [Amborella trichopoda]
MARFVKTYKYELERKACAPVFPNLFASITGISGLARGAVLGACRGDQPYTRRRRCKHELRLLWWHTVCVG